MPLPAPLLEAFAATFYGYGDYAAPYWFVGMEEGGGNSIEEVRRRVDVWDERGRRELEALPEYSRLVGQGKWFVERPPLQSTWDKLARVVLAAEGREPGREASRQFQRDELGRAGGQTAVLELLPFPSPSVNEWIYGAHSDLPQLVDRETYRAHYAPTRAAHLRWRVQQHRPGAVVFFGLSYLDWWEVVSGGAFGPAGEGGVRSSRRDGTLFVATPHPVWRGATNDLFASVGRGIREAGCSGS